MIMINKGDGSYVEVIAIYAKDQDQYREISKGYTQDGELIFSPTYLINESYGYMPFQILADGDSVEDYTIWGNTVQDGTPTPDNPIEPEFVGEKTENLFGGTLGELFPLQIPEGTNVFVSKLGSGGIVRLYDENKNEVDYWTFRLDGTHQRYTRYFTAVANIHYVKFPLGGTEPFLTYSSTYVPYEPYGYKIPISSAGQTKNIYLGQVQTTRRINKLVLTGEEQWSSSYFRWRYYYIKGGNPASVSKAAISNILLEGSGLSTSMTFHITNGSVSDWNGTLDFGVADIFSTVEEFKSYLAAQYAAGTPVTVWYVLAEPEVGIVNEPLAKIGDYADSVDFSQAGIEIPTLKKPDTTIIDIETEVKPSVINLTYWGEWQDKTTYLSSDNKLYITTDNQIYYTKR